MHKNTFYPLRRIVSNLVPLKTIQQKPPTAARLIYESVTAKSLNLKEGSFHNTSLDDVIDRNIYKPYLLKINSNGIIPGNGMDKLPNSAVLSPLSDNNSFLSLFGATDISEDLGLSRKLAVKYLIEIDNDSFFKKHGRKPLIGGICFKGYPYAHFRMNVNGENASNFGLPREVRITCVTLDNSISDFKERITNFLDEEITSVDQQITSHSGFHYVCCDPTTATHIILELSDFPFFTTNLITDNNYTLKGLENMYGYLIPYLHVFEYEEKTRYATNIPSGFLGATKNSQRATAEKLEWRLLNTTPDGVLEYYDFTAASIFGQQRVYDFISNGNEQEFSIEDITDILTNRDKEKKPGKKKIPRKYKECFISKSLKPNDNITLFFEQGEEFDRCISGIRLLMPFVPLIDFEKDIERIKQITELFLPEFTQDLLTAISSESPEIIEKIIEFLFKIPELVKFCSRTRIRIFEIDPVDGISPVNVKTDNKYATLLTDVTIDTLSEILLSETLDGIKFNKASSAKYFAIEFTNVSDESAQVVVQSLKFIQSAHVSVTSRAAKTQRIKNLQFRIVGPGIADDYARLGNEGFNFCIERQTAGKRGEVLFRANSLMDLLHTGVGKIYSNSRRRGVEFEQTINTDNGIPGSNYEIRNSIQKSQGWRSNETGKDVSLDTNFGNDADINIKPTTKFESYGNQESRNHSEQLFPSAAPKSPWKFISNYFGLIADIKNDKFIKPQDLLLAFNNLIDSLEADDKVWLKKQWKGFKQKELIIKGTNSISISPFTTIRAIEKLIEFGERITPGEMHAFIETLGEVLLLNPFTILTGGQSANVSVSPGGVGISLGVQPFPNFSNQVTYGSSGNVNKQASETRYSFGQFLSKGGDSTDSKFIISEGEMKRIITRKEVPDTDRQRIKGSEVMWQDELVDIITGTIPLNFDLPATSSKMYLRTSDDSLRVRFGTGVGKSVTVDFWFDLNEENIKDDY